ncbi:mRNA-capping enzyme, partial [Trifolium pratense]
MIPSKVPLGESFNDCILPGKRYSFKQVIHQQRVLNRKLGLVIDLTNTSRYYPVTDLKKEGIKHVKIQCRGRDSVPENSSVNQFVYEVIQFLSRQKQSKKYILVHCTHGHNRTGYMIIHYLMRAMSMSVTQAIKIFSEARPPGIYKPDYIDALYTFYHEKKPEMVVCPPTPDWKRSSEFDLNGEAVPDDDDDGLPGPDLQENQETGAQMTNDDVLGDEIPADQQDAFRQFCYQTLRLGVGARGHAQFPGSHPVSLNRDNLQLLRQRYYYATWKADGTRLVSLVSHSDQSGIFNSDFVKSSSSSPPGGLLVAFVSHQNVTYESPSFETFVKVNQWLRPFCERWKMLEKEVIEPRNYERQHIYQSRNPYYRYDLEPFRACILSLKFITEYLKPHFLLWLTVDIFEMFRFGRKGTNVIEYFCLMGWDDPYVPRTHEGLLKWKYANLNSVDFLFEVEGERELLFVNERGKKKLMDGNKVAFKGKGAPGNLVCPRDGSDPSLYSGKIIECTWDFDNLEWIFLRIRTDKSTPNEFNTYRKVMRSIKDNITEEDLLNEINEIIRLPMYADRIKTDSKATQHANAAKR